MQCSELVATFALPLAAMPDILSSAGSGIARLHLCYRAFASERQDAADQRCCSKAIRFCLSCLSVVLYNETLKALCLQKIGVRTLCQKSFGIVQFFFGAECYKLTNKLKNRFKNLDSMSLCPGLTN